MGVSLNHEEVGMRRVRREERRHKNEQSDGVVAREEGARTGDGAGVSSCGLEVLVDPAL
jgi:hypothetical protein